MPIDALAHELIDCQQTAKRLLEAGDMDAWLAAMPAEFRAAERLRSHLLNNSVVVTDDPVVKQLLAGMDLTELDDADKVGRDLLWGAISPSEYATSLAFVDVLIAPFQIPSDLRQFLTEARKCYALGYDVAVQSLCRTILEAAINDIAVKTGKVPKEAVEQNLYRQYPLWQRCQSVAGDLHKQIYDDLYCSLCKVVHGRTTSGTHGALGSLTKTIGFVQHLYELNKEQMPR
jgi:hypothetical protein